jgi:hypothetical protein
VKLKVGNAFYTAVVNIGVRENGDSVLYTINPITKGADLHGFGDDKGAVSTKTNTAPDNKAATPTLGEVRNPTPDKGATEKPITDNIPSSAPKSKEKQKNNFSASTDGFAEADFVDLDAAEDADGGPTSDSFADPAAAGDADASDPDVPRPVALPELVKIVKELLGKVPTIRKSLKNGAYGAAMRNKAGEWVDVQLAADLPKSPAQAVKTLAHEIGHILSKFGGTGAHLLLKRVEPNTRLEASLARMGSGGMRCRTCGLTPKNSWIAHMDIRCDYMMYARTANCLKHTPNSKKQLSH